MVKDIQLNEGLDYIEAEQERPSKGSTPNESLTLKAKP
jgi:hypothetical protein